MDPKVLIEKYIEGTLNKEEKKTFEKLRVEDEVFDRLAWVHDNMAQVTKEENDPVRNMIEEFESEHTPKLQTAFTWKKLLVAASIFIVFGLAVLYNVTRPVSADDLYESYFESYPNVVHVTVRGENEKEVSIAFEAYETDRYEEALTRFGELYKDRGTAFYLFYMGNALLELDRTEEAIELLKEFSTTEDNLADKAGWYLAMAYLKMNDKESAKVELKKVVEERAFNATKAKELLAELE